MKSSNMSFMSKKPIQNKLTLSEEHMANLLIVSLINQKMIFSKFLENTQIKSVQMVLSFSISSDVLMSIITYKSVMPKDKTMLLQEYTLKDFLIDFLKKVLSMLLIFNKDLLLRLKIWSSKLKVLTLSFLFLKVKSYMKEFKISSNKEISISIITQLKMNKK